MAPTCYDWPILCDIFDVGSGLREMHLQEIPLSNKKKKKKNEDNLMSSSTLEALTIYIFKICKNVLKQTHNTNVKSNTVLINTENKIKV